MSNTDVLRLRVYVRITRTPVTVEIEFPDKELAQRYRQSIPRGKKLLFVRNKPHCVKFELPRSAFDLEMSRSLEAIVLHFDTDDDAERWADDICLPVKGQAQQVYIKHYWDETELAELRKKLKPLPDRAGSPPGVARASRAS